MYNDHDRAKNRKKKITVLLAFYFIPSNMNRDAGSIRFPFRLRLLLLLLLRLLLQCCFMLCLVVNSKHMHVLIKISTANTPSMSMVQSRLTGRVTTIYRH